MYMIAACRLAIEKACSNGVHVLARILLNLLCNGQQMCRLPVMSSAIGNIPDYGLRLQCGDYCYIQALG